MEPCCRQLRGVEMKVYVVVMYRWGDRQKHSYVLGVWTRREAALKSADDEEVYRGGKYEAEVLRFPLNSRDGWRIVKKLPPALKPARLFGRIKRTSKK